jgi:hypothetical protein
MCMSLVACGGDDDGGGNGTPDASVSVTGEVHEYVLTSLTLPSSGNASRYAFDVDGIDTPADNKLGGILAVIPGDPQGQVTDSITGGQLVLLSGVQADSLTDDSSASWQVWLGDTGTAPALGGSYTISASSPQNAVLVGSIDDSGTFEGRNGIVPISVPIAAVGPPISVTLYGAAIRAKVTNDEFADTSGTDFARLGGAIKKKDVDDVVVPTIADISDAYMMADAEGTPPGADCTCAGGERTCQEGADTAAAVASLFDADNDCDVTATEVTAAIGGFLNPDVDLFKGSSDVDTDGSSNNYAPGEEGEEGYDSISLGLGIGGVRASFARPGE